MQGQATHEMLPRRTHDEASREALIASLRKFVVSRLFTGNRSVYERRAAPRYMDKHGRMPSTVREVKEAMEADDYYRLYGLINRGTQELLWDTVGESVERQIEDLKGTARDVAGPAGSLELNPDLELPTYATSIDIHVMPGGFCKELGEEDVFAGALYDRGVYVYAYGGLGPWNDGVGQATVSFLKAKFPDFAPRRVLDLGCGVGLSTLPFVDAYPEADVFGIDLSAPMLRYAHARAEAIRKTVHFSQQDGTRTKFANESFDLVVSNIVLHELPQKTTKALLAECFRLLKPGGITLHNDMTTWPEDPFDDFMQDWNTLNNNEPFQRGSGTIDWVSACTAAGFLEDDVINGTRDAAFMREELSTIGMRGARKR